MDLWSSFKTQPTLLHTLLAVLCRLKCRDVRTREAGIQDIHHQVRWLPSGRGMRGRMESGWV